MTNVYTVNTTGGITVGKKCVIGSPFDVYTSKRGFLRFNISSLGINNVNDIEWVKLNIYCTTFSGVSSTYRLRYGTSSMSNWGTVLEANYADFTSTNTFESEQVISSTGWKTFNINKSHLSLSDWLWLRLNVDGEGDGSTSNMTFRSQNYGTPSLRPYLEIKLKNRHSSVIIY